MPSVSGPQHRAMEAAAHGASTLGIPKSVGEEFSEADRGKHFGDDQGRDANGRFAPSNSGQSSFEHGGSTFSHTGKSGVRRSTGEAASEFENVNNAGERKWRTHGKGEVYDDAEEPAEIADDPIMAKLDEIFDAAQVLSYRLGKLEAEKGV